MICYEMKYKPLVLSHVEYIELLLLSLTAEAMAKLTYATVL